MDKMVFELAGPGVLGHEVVDGGEKMVYPICAHRVLGNSRSDLGSGLDPAAQQGKKA